jgi:heme-degrading monooxygenase HmoA
MYKRSLSWICRSAVSMGPNALRTRLRGQGLMGFPMIVVVFRARRTDEGLGEEYKFWLERMAGLARQMPGYISHKAYVAEDGERLTLFEWQSADTLRAWASHPEHIAVQELGRRKFYTEYHLQVCELVRESTFTRPAEPLERTA